MNQAILRKIGEIGMKIEYQLDAGYFKIFMYICYSCINSVNLRRFPYNSENDVYPCIFTELSYNFGIAAYCQLLFYINE